MAEKSGRSTESAVILEENSVLAAAAYIRAAAENENHGADASMQAQELLIKKYIDEHPSLQLAEIYRDKSSSTDADHPEFVRLMDDVFSGKIQCIVVKDLSRFGRDCLKAGYYLEHILPKLNVRLIAVEEGFDSFFAQDRERLALLIKNMADALYAKGRSRKILTAKEAHKNQGQISLVKAPYGYTIGQDKQHLEVDKETAPYVRMMFQWTLLGVSKKEIANRLNLLGIATPGQRQASGRATVPLTETKWNGGTVSKILENPSYCGDLVLGKQKQSLYQGIKQHKTAPEEWIIQKDKHPPMIARDDYNEIRIQQKEVSKRRKEWDIRYQEDREKYRDSFPGMVRCAECGKTMYFVRYTHNYSTREKAGSLYSCEPKTHTLLCSGNKIQENYLKIRVMDQIQAFIKTMCSRKKLLEDIKRNITKNAVLSLAAKRIEALKREIAQAEEKNAGLYMDYEEGLIEAEDYQYMKAYYLSELQKKRGKLQEEEQAERVMEKKIETYIKMAERLEAHQDNRSFDEKLVQDLVEYIEVSVTGTVQVHFRYKAVCEEIAELLEADTDEAKAWFVS